MSHGIYFQTAEKPKSGEGIFSRIFGIGKKNKNEMKLPDDKKKPVSGLKRFTVSLINPSVYVSKSVTEISCC